ncbi:MAG: chitobiase/beta-hexosaminidase C-terminal domain-containing protein [Planctomycetota bacterium]|nr:chitobiase/beta-hexosaminidase C-terminal domain-containing protein [Planctomycetota bacterium]
MTVRLAEADWTIRYTLDGSDPHRGGQTAHGPIRVDQTGTLRVIGISLDGRKHSREALTCYTIQAPLPATTPGKEPGLTLRAYGGVDMKHGLTKWLADIQGDAGKPVAEAAVSALGETADLLRRATGKTNALTYTGTLTVPETLVYEFEILWRGGLFFPRAGKPLEAIGRRSPGIAAVSVPLEKGSHPVLMV